MILVDYQIREAVQNGSLGIENFMDTSVQPASYDLRIGPTIYSNSSDKPDQPIDLVETGGNFRIPPYGGIICATNETLRMPSDMVGRFGLKSGFTRKGLHASTGPQVDPGFKGKLFVSLLNLTPVSHIISYQEEFLTIEFNKLQHKPQQTYEGPYQGLESVGREILEDLIRFEGLNLSQMQAQFTELTHHVKEWSRLATKVDDFLANMERHSSAIERLVEQKSDVKNSGIIQDAKETRSISHEKAKKEILSLFKNRKRLFYSDIAEKLELDFATVVNLCGELENDGLIEAERNEAKTSQRSRKSKISKSR